MSRLIQYEYRRPGKGSSVFEQLLVRDEPDVKVMLLQAYEGAEIRIQTETVLDAGAPVLWFVFPGAWYDVGRFHRTTGQFTGWYTNICTPVAIRGNSWSSTDLFLDHWKPARGPGAWLDEDEFADAMGIGLLDRRHESRVADVRQAIDRKLAAGAWPPPVARDFSLDQALQMLDHPPGPGASGGDDRTPEPW